jgi:iron complex transport system ATP-binding protein
VTHHVEEIPAGVTHALLMRDGRIISAGPIGDTLTSANLEVTFGLPLELQHQNGRYTARAIA